MVSGLLATLSSIAVAGTDASPPDDALLDIGRGLFGIADQPLTFVETDGVAAKTLGRRSGRVAAKKAAARAINADVAEVASTLQSQYPGEWTTFGHAPAGEPYDYDFVFTDQPPAAVITQIDRLPVEVRVRWGAPLNAEVLQAAQLAVLAKARELFPEHSPTVELGLSPMNTVLGVFIGGDIPSPAPMTATEVSNSLKQAVDAAVGENTLSVVAEFDPTLEPAIERIVLSGGRNITGCTSGFGAYRPSTGRYGVISAWHCPEPSQYSNGTSSPIGFTGFINGAAGQDIKFFSIPSPHTANSKFRVNTSGTEFTVSSVANPGSATSISMYGRNGGRGNGSVTDTNVCYTGVDENTGVAHDYCGGFKTNVVTVAGDSGGPCFDAGAARGVISVGNSTTTWCANIQGAPSSVNVLQN